MTLPLHLVAADVPDFPPRALLDPENHVVESDAEQVDTLSTRLYRLADRMDRSGARLAELGDEMGASEVDRFALVLRQILVQGAANRFTA